MTKLIPVITTEGIAAVFNAQHQGLDATVTEIALGDTGWTPDESATALKSEKRRIPILGGERIGTAQIHLTAVEDGASLEYWVRELGFYLADGTLLAIWSDQTQKLAYKSAMVDLLLALDLILTSLPDNSVTVDGTAGFTMPFARTDKEGTVRLATEEEATEGMLNSAVALTPATNQMHGDARYAKQLHRHPWSEIDNKPASYTPSSHRHNWSELDAKPAVYPPENHHHDDLYLKRTEFRIMSPAGAVMAFAMENPPSGWLECDGSAISRTAYADLYVAIGITYGYTSAADFRLPDLRGEFVRGWDHGRGIDPGRGFRSWQGDEFKEHKHSLIWGQSGGGLGSALGNNIAWYGGIYMNSTSSQGGNETRPRNLALMYCIKY